MKNDMTAPEAHQISMSSPSIGEGGRTGDWRDSFPVIRDSDCLPAKSGKDVCQLCWVHCPDNCIARGAPPVIDLEYCKGCGICAQVCPSHAIDMLPEGSAR